MSDSELSEASTGSVPSDRELEKSLRQEVTKAHKARLEFSVNDIRTASEQRLGLEKDYFRNHEVWARRSKEVIKDQMTALPDDETSPTQPEDEARKQRKPATKKRRSVERQTTSRKKQKIVEEEDNSEDESSPLSEVDSDPPKLKSNSKKRNPPAKRQTTKSKSNSMKTRKNLSEAGDSAEDRSASEAPDEADNKDADSDSEMSVLLDEEPKPKKKREAPKGRQKKPAATKAKPDADLDPDQAEIKRLQGWLVKCGIRKLWGKELKPYETSRAKIKHLKDMLADVGMTGRYSIEKANQIKEARELAADIEAVQEGAERWGAGEEAQNQGRPARRLVRGAKNYDFLSSDGEETD
ncbi:hypothetical protein PV08_07871 [Exophiala spinifera]|uniref:Transcriptional regulator n=1 Tax=Exophiala spinifera TaxID=91928 RepID=A0A0D2BV30_9EURO|nr:uncharacterized protein PV08_07871 [Exophiala spinifera]KIW15084.1 hypothetical protein PV08_07871 [Exophiala spinifera]